MDFNKILEEDFDVFEFNNEINLYDFSGDKCRSGFANESPLSIGSPINTNDLKEYLVDVDDSGYLATDSDDKDMSQQVIKSDVIIVQKRGRGRPPKQRTPEERDIEKKRINKKSAERYRSRVKTKCLESDQQLEQLEDQNKGLHQECEKLIKQIANVKQFMIRFGHSVVSQIQVYEKNMYK